MNILATVIGQSLLFVHLLAFAFAIVTVLREDMALLTARRVDVTRLADTERLLIRLIALLWLSGLSLIVFDIGFDAAALLSKPKLAAKLTVVSLLTVNGLLLHRIAFPILKNPRRHPRNAATVCAVLGAISTVSWLFASFVGVARLIAPALSYHGFMLLYLLSLLIGLGIALGWVRARLERVLSSEFSASDMTAPSILRTTSSFLFPSRAAYEPNRTKATDDPESQAAVR